MSYQRNSRIPLTRQSSLVHFQEDVFIAPQDPSHRRTELAPPSPCQRAPSFDVTDYPARFGALSTHQEEEPEIHEQKRGSDDTLADLDAFEPTKPDKVVDHDPPRRQRSIPDDGRYTYPGHPHCHHTCHCNWDEERRSKKPSGGVVNAIKRAFHQLTKEQDIPSPPTSRAPSRRNSLNAKGPHAFGRSLSLNAPDEDFDPYHDDDEKRRQSTDWGKGPEIARPGMPVHRKSYSERRKREKHTIKYCAESVEAYQKFCLCFAKALLAFGSPSHRIEAQLNSLAKVFQIEAQFLHTTGTIQVSFGDPESRNSETCLIKSPTGLALGRIHAVHNIYREVIHDEMYASDGAREIRKLLHAPPRYGTKIRLGLAFITCLLICGIAFGGSLNDMWVAGVAGLIVRIIQIYAAKSELSASGSEVFSAALVAFIARGLASVSSQIWCFTAISSSGVISMLPGFLILSGSLDIAGKNIGLGAPKIVSGIMTSLYLGFGLTLGSDVFLFFDKPARLALANNSAVDAVTVLNGYFLPFNATSLTDEFTGQFSFQNTTITPDPTIVQGCYRDPNWPWYLQPMPWQSLFLLVPLFTFFSSMNNQQHWWSRQMIVMVSIACVSFTFTRLANNFWGLENHPDYVALIGSLSVGLFGNLYSRKFGGTAFTSMLTGILLLVPDGLSAAGGLAQNYHAPGEDEYTQSLNLARKMISVIIGIIAGVYSSAAFVYFFGKKKNAALVTF